MLRSHRAGAARAAVGLLALLIARAATAGELEGSLTLRENVVTVQVLQEDQSPARGVRVALLDQHRNLVSEGRTDLQGRWCQPIARPGKYEVVVGAGAAACQTGMPFTVRSVSQVEATPLPGRCPHCQAASADRDVDRDTDVPFPWLETGVALAFLGGAGLVFWWGKRNRRAGASDACAGPQTAASPANLEQEGR